VGRSPWHPYKESKKQVLRKVSAGDVFYCPARFACLSTEAQDFVKALLAFDPETRLSAAEALQHPWLRGLTESKSELDEELTRNLRKVEQVTPFRKVCLSMAAWQLSSKETAELRKQFHAMDITNSGALSLEAFRKALDDNTVDVERLFANADLDNDGEIGFNSFVVASLEQRPSQMVLRLIFNRLDADKNGKITANDLASVLGPTFEGVPVEDLIKEVDASWRGAINWNAFSAYLMNDDVDNSHSESDQYKTCFLKQKIDKIRSLVGLGN